MSQDIGGVSSVWAWDAQNDRGGDGGDFAQIISSTGIAEDGVLR